MSEREHAAEIAELKAQAVTPKLKVFNTAVRNVLNGYAQTCASPSSVMNFLHGAYEPFGIAVAQNGGNIYTFTATDVALVLGIYSYTGRPHGHAVASIIDRLNIGPEHIEVAAYGVIGVSVRYDKHVILEVDEWLAANGYPHEIPHLDFDYHIYYSRQTSLFDSEYSDGWFGETE